MNVTLEMEEAGREAARKPGATFAGIFEAMLAAQTVSAAHGAVIARRVAEVEAAAQYVPLDDEYLNGAPKFGYEMVPKSLALRLAREPIAARGPTECAECPQSLCSDCPCRPARWLPQS